MDLIHILPPEVVAKTAAGEVVLNPSSVVKELMENSIDAGATRIEIDIEENGLKKIVVSDNGDGMSKKDLLICFLAHTTSKIKSVGKNWMFLSVWITVLLL